ncbi:hydrogenase maturation nickel metallochaperone HypA [Rhodoferax sp.]|jgi:hydrogenase nickel incorporation protein HypA/HybF|uniref:hydrogenase maturation nickel metallochaperone HypA n=1 Tax=Rhodoferax sp. TaxID=50421 RepID=UPI00272092B5|nr:hydrogenase maturation nickel metallochaperone HypA [Rhodoferax sp.]MDO9143922.1 hydrogenase maturation nickel metallochaperone HypA [Rhodoferax sp.]MDP3865802.1 hydrogenase maturation nickel metallochaperone HypA [Rhodoferax sp.]
MHEMSLAEGVLQLIEDAARRDQFNKVSAVWLEIGQLSGVEPEALAFCFDAVTRGTVADGARLEIITLPGQGWCEACARTVPLTEVFGECPQCGSYPLQVTAGTDMRVKELEVS